MSDRASMNAPPYRTDIAIAAQTSDGLPFTVRSIAYSDAEMLVRFHATLSEQTVRRRYFQPVSLHARINQARLARICSPDAESEAVLVAVRRCDVTERDEVVGIGRLEQVSHKAVELAVVVADLWQGHGIGTILLDLLIAMAKDRGMRELNAYILRENEAMQRLCRDRGFDVHPTTQTLVRARLAVG